MLENDRTFDEIRHFMDIKGIKISLMALSRHFSRHYPQRKLYLEHMECRQVKVDREVGLKIDHCLKIIPKIIYNYTRIKKPSGNMPILALAKRIAVIMDRNIIENMNRPEPLSFRFKTVQPRRM